MFKFNFWPTLLGFFFLIFNFYVGFATSSTTNDFISVVRFESKLSKDFMV